MVANRHATASKPPADANSEWSGCKRPEELRGVDTMERSGSRRREWLPMAATVTEIVSSGREMGGGRGSLAIGIRHREQLLPPRGREGHCTGISLEGTFGEQQGRMSQGEGRARDKEGAWGGWDIGDG